MRRACPWLLIGLAAFFGNVANAIDPDRAMSQYIRTRWGTEQGFPRGPVYAIAQTADGYLWIGADAGLIRFDGLNFRLVQDEPASFTITNVLGLTPDNEGNLWVRLQGSTMLRYRGGLFDDPVSSSGPPYTRITAMCQTNQGALLFSKMQQGAATYRQGKLEMLADATGLPRSPVLSIAQTADGSIWLGTRDAGLFRLGGGQTSHVTKGLPDPKINCLLPGGERDLWVGTDNGIVRWNGRELTAAGIPATLNRFQALAVARDRDANIWVGTDSRGLLRFNAQGVSSLDKNGNGSSEAVTAVFEDREGNIWTGSANGIERLRDSVFVTYSSSEGLPSQSNGPIYVDEQDRTWFAPIDGGLYWLSKGKTGRITDAGLGKDVVYSIAGSAGELWIGRQRGGLTHLRSAAGSFTAKTYTQAEGLAQNSVYAVHQNRDGTVWAGTLSGGVSKFSNGKFTTYTTTNGLSSNTVSSILESTSGTMWFATPNGLSALSKDGWQVYTVRDGLPSENVNCLLEDSTGVLWIGTAAGLAFLSSGRVQSPAGAPASLGEQILGVAEDRNGSLWIATSNHVLRVRRDKLMRGALAEGDVREYGLADGLHGIEGVKRHRSVVADPFGHVWFSLNRGLSVVDPARLTSISAAAIVHIQTISADGAAIAVRGPVRIPPARQRITFGYAGLSLSVPERVRFRYTLDGFDRGWSEPTAAREAIYTNLGPGSYRFRAIASNTDGVWNSAEAAIGFEIEPVFWQTGWFRLCVVAACIFATLGVYRFRLHQLTRQLSVRFEERLAERTRIGQELHDTLLQGFLSASMQLHVAVDRLPVDSPAKPPLSRVLELMGQVIQEGRNAVRGLRSSHSSSLDLEQAFSRIQQELAIEDEIEFRVIVEGRPQPLHPVLRDEVYRIGREALVNAFRHSRAKSVEVELEYAARHFRFLVRDNGCGIDPKVLRSGREGHWGLPGMRERAERIGARLHVWSSATAGTEVELSVPSHVAFQVQSSHGLSRWFSRLNKKGEK
jgi:signal transduction histidine kinase/ligand-binding sensor domain-containing protein